MCYKTHTTTINPIIDWSDGEVWEFIKEYNIPYCCLYDEGFKRLGCIGCPMGTVKNRKREFERWPKYKALYLKAFEQMIENRGGTVKQKKWANQTAEDVMDGYLTENFTHPRGGTNRLYPYATTRAGKDWSEMTAEEVIEWWIK